jgi:hypothetical protein
MWKPSAMAAVTETWSTRSDVRVNVEEIRTIGGAMTSSSNTCRFVTSAAKTSRCSSQLLRGSWAPPVVKNQSRKRPILLEGALDEPRSGRLNTIPNAAV